MSSTHTLLARGAILAALVALALPVGCSKDDKKSSSSSGTVAKNDGTNTAGDADGTDGGTPGANGATNGAGTGSAAAGDGSTPGVPGSSTPGSGCLQGVVMDGYNGQRVDLSKLTDPSGIYVLIHGRKVKAQVYAGDANLAGEYYICDIPVEETYPVFAYLPGYLPFESSVNITSTRAIRVTGNQAVAAEEKIPDPIAMTNIRLFPLGNAGRDLRIHVVAAGSGVPDVTVDLEPQAAIGHFAFNGTFANSADTRLTPLRAKTDADGYAVFSGGDLSLGASYNVLATPPASANLGAATHATFLFGISGAVAGRDGGPYELSLPLGDGLQPIAVVSCSKEFLDFSETGSVAFEFNRDIQLVNLNLLTADIAGGGSLVANDPSNAVSEQVLASISGGTRLTLSPNFKNGTAPKRPDASKPVGDTQNTDRDATITFHLAQVMIRVVGDTDQNFVPLANIQMPAACKAGTDVTTRFWQQIF
jgi:hypothetical protein